MPSLTRTSDTCGYTIGILLLLERYIENTYTPNESLIAQSQVSQTIHVNPETECSLHK